MTGPSKVTRARLGVFAGVVMVAVGVFLVLGIGWALIAGGIAVSAAFLLLYDVDEQSGQEVSR